MSSIGVYAGLVPGYHPAHYIQHAGQSAAPSDNSCPPNQIIDASTWKCAPICPDSTRPCGGNCIGYAGAPLAQGAPCPGAVVVPEGAAVGCPPGQALNVFGNCVSYAEPGQVIVAGKVMPKWMLYAAGGVAALLVGLLAWHLWPKGAAVAAKAASYFR